MDLYNNYLFLFMLLWTMVVRYKRLCDAVSDKIGKKVSGFSYQVIYYDWI